MGMPITVEIVGLQKDEGLINEVFEYFDGVDQKFSTYKKESEITLINEKKIKPEDYSEEMKTVLSLCEKEKKETNGYFDINNKGKLDPSGLVKGWAIYNAAEILKKNKIKNFYVEAGGDIQVWGKNANGKRWKVGIRNPFKISENVKIVRLNNEGMATSGTYLRGQHIYNPKNKGALITEIVSLTVIGTNIYEADLKATSAFAMGKKGIYFIEDLPGFEAYVIDNQGIATYTSGFKKYTEQND